MGFHLRKTKKLGLFNFNLSNSGIGTSFGIKGLRIGVDGKGRAYVGGGKGILRFRQYFGSKKNDININDNENLYFIIKDKIPYMFKENTLVIMCKILYFPMSLLLIGLVVSLFVIKFTKDEIISMLPFVIFILWLGYSLYFSKLAKSRKLCNLGLKELKNNNIQIAIEFFKKANNTYKNTHYNKSIDDIINVLSQQKN